MVSMAGQLRERLGQDGIIVAPGAYDMMSLLLANQHQFSAHYASGYWVTASILGLPDVGIATYRDFITQFARLAQASSAPLIADADTGFGSLVNLDHATRGYQDANIAAMQIEDQCFPKVCGQHGATEICSIEEMQQRVKVSCTARDGGDMLIIARTDARRSEGRNAALNRLGAYADAGADIVFLEAPKDACEIEEAAQHLKKPLMINAAHGGHGTILNPSQYASLGVKIIIYPSGPALAAAKASDNFYGMLAADDANSNCDGMFDFPRMSSLLGFDDAVMLEQSFNQKDN
ncbi:MAG: isocitrate lyase/PEP mutase family protein [Erythrobacter sp.]